LWPEGVPRSIDIPEVRLDSLLADAAAKWPDAVATSYFGFDITYAKLNEIANRIAAALASLGIQKGDTVAAHFTNTPAVIAAYFGILRAGARVTLVSPLFKSMEIRFQLNDSEAKAYIYWEGFDQSAEPILTDTCVEVKIKSSMAPWISPDPLAAEPLDPEGNVLWLEDLMRNAPAESPATEIDPKEDIACLQYTGGTTGLPKAAMLTHYNLVANVYQCKAWFPTCEDCGETMMTALPLYHIYAQTVCQNFSILIGAKQVLVSNARNVEELIEAIEHHHVTIFPGVSALYNMINNYPGIESHDLRSVKFCLSGAGPLPLEIQKRFEELTGAKLREGYGLTEASPVTHANRLDDVSWPGFIGLPISSTLFRIIDPSDRRTDVDVGVVGELCITGPQVMKGYYKREAETDACLVDIDGDGTTWLFTGDLAEVDERGLTKIRDRAKNLIKYKGHSVYPAEVEDYMFQNPNILDVAVVGVPDEEAGETIKAFVVLKDFAKDQVSEQDIIDWAKENMASYKYPRFVTFIDEIPKGTAGKTMHRFLREGHE
jgi:long-chain acyl-CoA synthetase